jgi:hypothetical protein
MITAEQHSIFERYTNNPVEMYGTFTLTLISKLIDEISLLERTNTKLQEKLDEIDRIVRFDK